MTAPLQWLDVQTIPWLSSEELSGRLIDLTEQMLRAAQGARSVTAVLRDQLPELGAELGALWLGILRRNPDWEVIAQHGRNPWSELPRPFLADSIDRDAAGCFADPAKPGWKLMAVPLASRQYTGAVLVLAGRNFNDESLAVASAVSKAVAVMLDQADQESRLQRRIEHLRATLGISSSLAMVHETEPLLDEIAQAAVRLLECDRASIFLWDRDHKELVACPAIGVEGGMLRIPDKAGIVGEVIHSTKSVRVDDAYSDARFNQQVDAGSGYRTRNLLCVPLWDAEGKLIGAFEVLNKRDGRFSEDDEVTLTDLAAQVAAALQNTRERELLMRSHRELTEQASRGVTIIGDSPSMMAMRSKIRRLAATDLPVLILGESGTGKEVVAQALHYQGPRAGRPFIAVNCAALTETLLESELFGHEKGSFTDAHEMRRGKFELAEGGTLFLDEIGDMSLGGQAKLLRVLEQKVITRVGGSLSLPINTRIVAATNAHLADAVRAKRFREDLYYRLNVVTLDLPPLRDRPEDVIGLAEFFLGNFAVQARRPKLHLSPEARRRLQSHNWPGNVRELRNLMERVAFLAPNDKIEADDLAFILSPDRSSYQEPSPDLGLSEATNQFQQQYIRRAIQRVRNNMSEAARLLGLHRSNLYRKMRQLGMSEAGSEDEEEVAAEA